MKKKLFTIIVALFVATIMAVPAMADVTSDANAGASVEQNYGDSYSRTGLAVPPQMTYPGLPSYFGPATNQPNYMKAGLITMFKKSFSRAEVEALLSSNQSLLSGLKARVNVFTGEIPKDERMSDDVIDVRLNKPEGNYAPVGYITIFGSKNRDSVDVFYAALEEAMNTLECEEVLVVGEGAMNILSTWGAGIGFSYTHAFLNDGNNKGDASGGSGTGGTGISWGEAGYRAKPWLQFILLNNLDTPTRHKVE